MNTDLNLAIYFGEAQRLDESQSFEQFCELRELTEDLVDERLAEIEQETNRDFVCHDTNDEHVITVKDTTPAYLANGKDIIEFGYKNDRLVRVAVPHKRGIANLEIDPVNGKIELFFVKPESETGVRLIFDPRFGISLYDSASKGVLRCLRTFSVELADDIAKSVFSPKDLRPYYNARHVLEGYAFDSAISDSKLWDTKFTLEDIIRELLHCGGDYKTNYIPLGNVLRHREPEYSLLGTFEDYQY